MKDSGREREWERKKEISASSTRILGIVLNFIVSVTKQSRELGMCVLLQMETKQNTRIPLMIFKNMFTTTKIYSSEDSVPEFTCLLITLTLCTMLYYLHVIGEEIQTKRYLINGAKLRLGLSSDAGIGLLGS